MRVPSWLWVTVPGVGFMAGLCLGLSWPLGTPRGYFPVCPKHLSHSATFGFWYCFSVSIIPYIAIDLMCPLEEVCKGSAYVVVEPEPIVLIISVCCCWLELKDNQCSLFVFQIISVPYLCYMRASRVSFSVCYALFWASLMAQTIKNLPAMQERQVWSRKKEMATHTSILAWRIPSAGEPGGLQFMGLQKIRHD